jgi:hypothetical protein
MLAQCVLTLPNDHLLDLAFLLSVTFLLSTTFLLSVTFLLPGVLSFGLHLDRKLFVVTVLAIWAALGIGIRIDVRRGGRCRIVTGQTSARRNEARSRVWYV